MSPVFSKNLNMGCLRKSFFYRFLAGFLIYLIGGFPTLVFALPQDGQIVAGQGQINQTSPTDMTINQSSDKLIADWKSFGIGTSESVQFQQPNSNSVALNRVLGADPSEILGKLSANGQVFLSNPSGVIFGANSKVNVGGLMATTLGISNQDFLDGNYRFQQDPSKPLASILNQGNIESSGFVGLLAPGVENRGNIVASAGSVAISSGEAASLDFIGDGLINFAITKPVTGDVLDADGNVVEHRVLNTGKIQAGYVALSAKSASDVIKSVVNNEGVIEAQSAIEKDGEIYLMGEGGKTIVSGTLDASGKNAGEKGGIVHVLGDEVELNGATIDASGDSGGGTVLVGGDFQGKGSIQTAKNTTVSENTTINANAINQGDGGKIIIWSDNSTVTAGLLTARGGAVSGNGGLIETSGKNKLDVTRAADVSATNGLAGTWLLDPRNIEITSTTSGASQSGGTIVASEDNSQIDVSIINEALNNGTSVLITTGSDGDQEGNIVVSAAIVKSAGADTSLTLEAAGNIIVNAPITSTSGALSVNLNALKDVTVNAEITTNGGDVSFSGVVIQALLTEPEDNTSEEDTTDDGSSSESNSSSDSTEDSTGDTTSSTTESSDANSTDGSTSEDSSDTASGEDSEENALPDSEPASTDLPDNETVNDSEPSEDTVTAADESAEDSSNAAESQIFQGTSDQSVLLGESVISADGAFSVEVQTDVQGNETLIVVGEEGVTVSFDGDFVYQEINVDSYAVNILDGFNAEIVNIDTPQTDSPLGGSLPIDNIPSDTTITVGDVPDIEVSNDFEVQSSGNLILTPSSGGLITSDSITISARVSSADSIVQLNSSINTGGGNVAFNKDVEVGEASASVDTGEGDGDVTFNEEVEVGSGGLTVDAGTGDVTLNDQVDVGENELTISSSGTTEVAETGGIEGDGGTFNATASEAVNVNADVNMGEDGVVGLTGGDVNVAENTTVSAQGGDITLTGGEDKTVSVFGTIDASDKQDGGVGGNVKILGDRVGLFDNAKVDVSGDAGGGEALIGGDYQGQGDTLTAQQTYIANSASVNADALSAGNGGKIIAWANDFANIQGNLSARGGSISGNGGFIETSGLNALSIVSAADVTAANGKGGEWLIDPNNIEIVAGSGASNINSTNPFESTGDSATVGVDLITSALIGGSNVTVKTGSGGTQAGIITLSADLDYDGTGTNTLSLIAHDDIVLNADIKDSNTGTSDSLNLVLTADSDLNGSGDLVVANGVVVETNGGNIDATVEDIDLQGTLDAGSGDVSITRATGGSIGLGQTAGSLTLSGDELERIFAASLNLATSNGDITVDGITAAQSNNVGAVLLNTVASNKSISFSNNASTFNALTANATSGIDVNVNLSTDSGAMTFNADTDVDTSSGGTFTVASGASVVSGSNSISITADDIDLLDVSGSLFQLDSSGDITISVSQKSTGNQKRIALGNTTSNCAGPGCAMVLSGSELRNIRASTLTYENSTRDIFVDGVTATQSDNIGTVNLVAGKDTQFEKADSTFNALTVSAKDRVDIRVNVTTDTGDMTLSADTDGTADSSSINDRIIFFGNPALTSAGKVTLNAQTVGIEAWNNSLVVSANNGIDVNGNVLALNGDVILEGDANNTSDGNDKISFQSGATVTSNKGKVILDSTTGGIEAVGPITVNAAKGITVNDNFTGNGAMTFNADTDVETSSGGTFTVASGASIVSGSNAISITADDIALQDVSGSLYQLDSLGDISISVSQKSTGNQKRISIGNTINCAGTGCAMALSGSELRNIRASTLTYGNSSRDIFVDGVTAAQSDGIGTLVLSSGGFTQFEGSDSTFNALTVNSKDRIDIRADITTDTGDMTFNPDTDGTANATPFFDRIATSGDRTLTSANKVIINAPTIGVDAQNDLTILADNGIEVTGNVVSKEDINFNGDANSSSDGSDKITLSSGSVIESTGGKVTLGSQTGGIEGLGAVTVRATDGIEVSAGQFTANGVMSFNADTDVDTSTGGTFTVASGASVFGGNNVFTITASDIDLQDVSGSLYQLDSLGNITISVAQKSSGNQVRTALGNTTSNCAGVGCGMTLSGSDLRNIRASTLTYENSTRDIFVDGVTAAQSDGIGTLVLSTEGFTQFEGSDSTFNALTVNSKDRIDIRADITTDTGDMILNADTDGTRSILGLDDRIATSGDRTLTSAGKVILDTNTQGNLGFGIDAQNGLSILADNGIEIYDDLTAKGNIVLDGDANGSADGFDQILFSSSRTIEAIGGSITLGALTGGINGNSTIFINATDGITISSGKFTVSGTATFNADTDVDTSTGGTFTVASGASVFAFNGINITARDIDLQDTSGSLLQLDGGFLDTSIAMAQPSSGSNQNRRMAVGNTTSNCDGVGCDFVLSGAELRNIGSSLGGSFLILNNSEEIFVDGITGADSDNLGRVTLSSDKFIQFSQNASTFNSLTVTTKDTIDIRADITTDSGTLALFADSDGTGNASGLSDRIVTFGNRTLTSAKSVILNASTVGVDAQNDLTLLSDDGITITGDVTAKGDLVLNADANNSFDGSDNLIFSNESVIESTGGSVTLGSLTGGIQAPENITINATDGITVSAGQFTVFGTATFNADTDVDTSVGGTFTIASGANVVSSGNAISITASDIDLQDVSGSLYQLDSLGNITISVAQKSSGNQVRTALGNTTSNCAGAGCGMTLSGSDLRNIRASTLTYENSTRDIFVDGVTAAQSDGIGTLVLSTEGFTQFEGSDSTFNALTVNSKDRIDIRADITTDTGDMTLNADTDGTANSSSINDRILFSGDQTLTSAGGVTLNASTVGTEALNSLTISANNGITVVGNVTSSEDINFNGDANSSLDGSDKITLSSGSVIESTGGKVTLGSQTGGIEGLGAVTVRATDGIEVSGGQFTANGAMTFNADTDVDTSTGGTFTVASGASVFGGNNVFTITASDIDLQDVSGSLYQLDSLGNITISVAQKSSGNQVRTALGNTTSNCAGAGCGMTLSGSDLRNIRASTLTYENSTRDIFVDGVTAAQSDGIGTLVLSTEGFTQFEGSDSTFNALTVNSKDRIDIRSDITTDTGDMTFNPDTDGTANATPFFDRIATSGDRTLTSANKVIINAPTIGVDAQNDLTILADNGIEVTGNVTSSEDINFNGDANSSSDGSDKITLSSGSVIESTGGKVTLGSQTGGIEGLGAVTVRATDGIEVSAGQFTANGVMSFNADTDVDTSIGGTFTVASGASLISNNNDIFITARDIDLLDISGGLFQLNSGTGDIAISMAQPTVGNQGQISLGTNSAGACQTANCKLYLDVQEFKNISAANLTFENTTSDITIEGISNANIGKVVLNIGRGVQFREGATTLNALEVNAKNNIDIRTNVTTQVGDLVLNADTDQTGNTTGIFDRITFFNDAVLTSEGGITLSSPTLAIESSGDVTFVAKDGITLTNSLEGTGDILLDGDSNNNADSNDAITLFSGIVIKTVDGKIVLRSKTGGINAQGAVDVEATDGVNIESDFTSQGTTTINADSDSNGNGDLTIDTDVLLSTTNNQLNIRANDLVFNGIYSPSNPFVIDAGIADTLIQVSDGGTLGLGSTPGDFTIDGLELAHIRTNKLTLGDNTNGDVTVDGITAIQSDNIGAVAIETGGSIHVDNNESVFNELSLTAVTDINVNVDLTTDTGNFAAVADSEVNGVGDFNLAVGTTVNSSNDIDVTANIINLNGQLVAGGEVTLNGDVNSGGDIVIEAADGVTIDQNILNAGIITIDADTDRNGNGDFTLLSGILINSFDNDIFITANDFIINGTIDSGTANLTLTESVGGTIAIGDQAGTGDINIDNLELQNITSANLIIGGDKNDGQVIGGVTSSASSNIDKLTLNSTKSSSRVTFQGGTSTLNDLEVNADEDVRIWSGVTAKDTKLTAGDDVHFWNGENNFDSVEATANDRVTVWNGSVNVSSGDATFTADAQGLGNNGPNDHDGGTGQIEVWSSGAVNTNGNNFTATGADFKLDGDINAGTGTVTLKESYDGRFALGDQVGMGGDHIDISKNEIRNITADNLVVGGDKNDGQWVGGLSANDTANIGKITLNATKSTSDIVLEGGASTLGDFELNAGDDIKFSSSVNGNTGTLNAGDDIEIKATSNIDTFNATAGDNIKIDKSFTSQTATLNAGNDVSIKKESTINNISVTAGDDIRIDKSLTTTGSGTFNAGDDIRLKGESTINTVNMTAGDDIQIDKAITASGAGSFVAGDDIKLKGNSSFDSLSISAQDRVEIDGDLDIQSGPTTISADSDGNGQGNLYIKSRADIKTNNNDLNLSANDLSLSGSINTGTGTTSVAVSDGGTIGLGSGSGNMKISGSELKRITSEKLVLGDETTQNIEVRGVSARNSNNIGMVELNALASGGEVNFVSSQSTFNALSVNAGGNINVLRDVTTDRGDFNAEADFDNTGQGAFTLNSSSTIESEQNISISGYGLNIDGNLEANGTITLEDKSF